jgi:AcrR family transcriptional regulator
VGTLGKVHSEPGLPRGRGSLAPQDVGRAQRERLLRAMTAAVAELGYAEARIADVVRRAHVSRQSFYEQFTDKLECFLEAMNEGSEVVINRFLETAVFPRSPRATVRAGLDAYLRLVADEPEFAQCMLVELQAAGPLGLDMRVDAHRRIAQVLRAWHQSTGGNAPDFAYHAAVGAVHELVFDLVATRRTADAPALAPQAAEVVCALLALPR